MIIGITKEQLDENKKKLEKEYEEKKRNICKKYRITEKQYDVFADIFANEQFKENISKLAWGDANQLVEMDEDGFFKNVGGEEVLL